jgi:hypothetical protein
MAKEKQKEPKDGKVEEVLDFSLHFSNVNVSNGVIKDPHFVPSEKHIRAFKKVALSQGVDLNNDDVVLHNTFEPEQRCLHFKQQIPIESIQLRTLTDKQVNWFGTSQDNLNADKMLMLQNLKRCGGTAFFCW